MNRLGKWAVIGVLICASLATGVTAQPEKVDPQAAEPTALPTEDDRKAMQAMLLKLEPEEKQLVAGLLMQLQEDQRVIDQLEQELATLKLFHRAVLKELEEARAQLSKLSASQPAAPAKSQVIKGSVTSVDQMAPMVIVKLADGRAVPVGTTLCILRGGKEMADARVITCEGSNICAEVIAQANAASPDILVGDEVSYTLPEH